MRLEEDDCWDVQSPEKYRVLERPVELGVGKLSDDWEFLQNLSEDRREAVALMLLHAAPLLDYIGERVGQ